MYRICYIQSIFLAAKYYANGGMYEKEIEEDNGHYKEIHYISGGNGIVAIYTKESGGYEETAYLLKDHLGSVYCYTDEDATDKQYMSFDAWGNRRNPDNWAELYTSDTYPTLRGFTGHEHIDLFRLINMNGRMYDPVLGRFLSADPFVQMPDNLQGLNRYSYCINNPLSHIDPSGYDWNNKVAEVMAEVFPAIFNITFAAAVTAATGGLGAPLAVLSGGVAGGFAGGFVEASIAGASNLEALRAGAVGGLYGGASAGVAFGIGEITSFINNDALKYITKSLAHGASQGGITELQGGRFIHGFAAGALSSASGSLMGNSAKLNPMYKVIISAAIGGTTSVIGGGKFANGAISGAYVYMFNDALHPIDPTKKIPVDDQTKKNTNTSGNNSNRPFIKSPYGISCESPSSWTNLRYWWHDFNDRFDYGAGTNRKKGEPPTIVKGFVKIFPPTSVIINGNEIISGTDMFTNENVTDFERYIIAPLNIIIPYSPISESFKVTWELLKIIPAPNSE